MNRNEMIKKVETDEKNDNDGKTKAENKIKIKQGK